MFVLFAFLGGLVGYACIASLPFTRLPVYHTWLFYTLGIVVGAGLNCLWLTVAKNVSREEVIVYGVLWDAMLTLTYVVVPILLWEQSVSWKVWAGVGLIFSGMLLAKFS